MNLSCLYNDNSQICISCSDSSLNSSSVSPTVFLTSLLRHVMLSLSQTKLLVPYEPCSARSWPPLRKRQFRLLNSQVTNLVIILDSFFSHHISNPSSNPEFIDKTHPEPNYSSSRHPYLVQSIILGLY